MKAVRSRDFLSSLIWLQLKKKFIKDNIVNPTNLSENLLVDGDKLVS